MPSDERVDRRIWWLTVSKAAERSSKMRTDDLESAFAIRRASVTESSAVSVEWPLLKPDCLASSLLYCERNSESWLKTVDSSGVTRACLNAVEKMPVWRDVLRGKEERIKCSEEITHVWSAEDSPLYVLQDTESLFSCRWARAVCRMMDGRIAGGTRETGRYVHTG